LELKHGRDLQRSGQFREVAGENMPTFTYLTFRHQRSSARRSRLLASGSRSAFVLWPAAADHVMSAIAVSIGGTVDQPQTLRFRRF
jgi:hypothetical protein